MEIIKAKTQYQTVQVNIPAASILSGSGAPVTTPVFVGQVYLDTTGGYGYKAFGTSSSSDWKETSFPQIAARVSTASLAITSGAVINFGTIDYNVGSGYSAGTFTAPSAGIYSVSASLYCNGVVTISVYKGSSQYKQGSPIASSVQGTQVNGTIKLAAGDTISIRGDANVTLTAAVLNYFEIARVA